MSEIERNQTALTHRILAGATKYFLDRGFRPVENEVFITGRWIADIGAIGKCSPTNAQNLKYIDKRPSDMSKKRFNEKFGYLYEKYKDIEDEREKKKKIMFESNQIWNEEYENVPHPVTVIIEVKTSRSDFFKDDKWKREIPANACYLAIPTGMLRKDELPKDWWVLEFDEDGGYKRLLEPGALKHIEDYKQAKYIYQIALRQHNKYTYQINNELQKKFAAEEREEKQRLNISKVAIACWHIANGGWSRNFSHKHGDNVKECLFYHGVKKNQINWNAEKYLESLWGVLLDKNEKGSSSDF